LKVKNNNFKLSTLSRYVSEIFHGMQEFQFIFFFFLLTNIIFKNERNNYSQVFTIFRSNISAYNVRFCLAITMMAMLV